MSGGIAIGLLIILVLILGTFGVVSYLTGGVLWWRKTDPEKDKVEGGGGDDDERPVHTHPTSPAQENTAFVGTPRGDRAREQS